MEKLFYMTREIEIVETVSSINLFKYLDEYYQEWLEKEQVDLVKYDDNIMILEEKESKIRVVICREELIPAEICMSKGWEYYWLGRCFKNYNYELNSKIKYFKNKGFYANNYAEFFISYSKLEEVLPETAMQKFKIDDVEFEIGSPSKIFKLIFQHISTDDHFEWEPYYTIKLRNVKKEMLEDYLQNAMYFLHKHCPSDVFGDYPVVYQYSYYDDYWVETEEVDESKLNTNFRLGKYPEALAFYNKGKLNRDVLNFYKVLEYFFLINRKNDFKLFILDYNQNQDIEKILTDITGVYRTSEVDLLKNLVKNISNLESIMGTAFSKGLISSKDDKDDLAKKIYDYRNSIVHGKGDTNLSLLVPSILDSNNNEWDIIIENIADLVIKQFCYA